MQTLILGFGKSGSKVAEFLIQKGDDFLCVDRRSIQLKQNPHFAFFPIISETDPIDWKRIERIVKSPGVHPAHSLLDEARRRHIPIVGEIDLALEELVKKKKKLIGITGSNGKTTTTLLLTNLLKEKAIAAGNVGYPLIGEVEKDAEIFIIELSSFQLESIHSIAAFDAAILLNITANHLDRYPDMHSYAQAKWRIQECIKEDGELFVQRKAFEEFQQFAYPLIRINFFDDHTEKLERIFPLEYRDGRAWPASHDLENLSAAYTVCLKLGISEEQFLEGTISFQSPPHRIEFIREFEGVKYVNDSKASSVDAVLKGVNAMNGQVILIAGGVDKGGSFHDWGTAFKSKVRQVLAIGEAAIRIEKELDGVISVSNAGNLKNAVKQAFHSAKKGDTVLLSPGCSSYDQFMDFEERGKVFRELVFALGEK